MSEEKFKPIFEYVRALLKGSERFKVENISDLLNCELVAYIWNLFSENKIEEKDLEKPNDNDDDLSIKTRNMQYINNLIRKDLSKHSGADSFFVTGFCVNKDEREVHGLYSCLVFLSLNSKHKMEYIGMVKKMSSETKKFIKDVLVYYREGKGKKASSDKNITASNEENNQGEQDSEQSLEVEGESVESINNDNLSGEVNDHNEEDSKQTLEVEKESVENITSDNLNGGVNDHNEEDSKQTLEVEKESVENITSDNLNEEVSDRSDENSECLLRIREKEELIQTLREEIAKKEEELKEIRNKNRQKASDSHEHPLMNTIIETLNIINNVQSESSEYKKKVKELKKELEDSKDRSSRLRGEIDAMKASMSKLSYEPLSDDLKVLDEGYKEFMMTIEEYKRKEKMLKDNLHSISKFDKAIALAKEKITTAVQLNEKYQTTEDYVLHPDFDHATLDDLISKIEQDERLKQACLGKDFGNKIKEDEALVGELNKKKSNILDDLRIIGQFHEQIKRVKKDMISQANELSDTFNESYRSITENEMEMIEWVSLSESLEKMKFQKSRGTLLNGLRQIYG